MEKVKINLGCGPTLFPGWLNLDANSKRFPGSVQWCWNDRIPCEDGAADLVVVQHALMYCKEQDYDTNFREIRRVLALGCVLLLKEDDNRRRFWREIGRRDGDGRVRSSTNPRLIKSVLDRHGFGRLVWDAHELVAKYPTIVNRVPNLLRRMFFIVECVKMR